MNLSPILNAPQRRLLQTLLAGMLCSGISAPLSSASAAGGAASAAPADSLVATFTLPFSNEFSFKGLVPMRKVSRPRLGLALSGGGLRGVAQIGVIQTLEEEGIAVDVLSGTSIGAVVGGLYAAGYSPADLWQAVQSMQLEKMLEDTPSRSLLFLAQKQKRARALLELRMNGLQPALPEAYTPGQRLSETLTNLLLRAPAHAFDMAALDRPLRIVTTDLLSGRKVVFSRGSLLDAMRASIAIPLLLSPVEVDSMMLVDGGLLDNIPVDQARDAGADLVLAVNCTAHLRSREDIHSPWTVADQVTTIMQQENNLEQLKRADLVVDFQDFSSTSTRQEDLVALYEEGRARTRALLPQLHALLQARQSIDAAPQFHIVRVQPPPHPQADDLPAADSLLHRMVSGDQIRAQLQRYHTSGWFGDVRAHLYRLADGTTLLQFSGEPLPTLRAVQFHNNRALPDSLLHRPFRPFFDRPINHTQALKAIDQVHRLYRQEGYSLAEISRIDFNEETGTAHLFLSEGRITAVRFQGRLKTRPYVLRREFLIRRGDLFQLSQAETGIDNLYATGLFQSVSLMAYPDSAGWALQVRLQEKARQLLRLGLHYDEQRFGRTFAEWADENLFGTADQLTLHAQYGTRNQLFSAQYNANRLFRTYVTSQITAAAQKDKFYFYQKGKIAGEYQRSVEGVAMGAGLQIARFGNLTGIMRLENIRTRNVAGRPIAPSHLLLQTLGIVSVIDTRDQTPFTDSGKYHKFFYEVATGKHLGSDISFFKVSSQMSAYYTLARRHTLSPRLLWGTADLTLPFSEQYRVGGDQSFYGLRQGERVGRNMITASLEYRYRLPGNRLFDFYLSGRFDFGAVWQNTIKVKAGDFISGKGLSLAIKTPIGPIAVSYGVASREQKRFYFSAGYNF